MKDKILAVVASGIIGFFTSINLVVYVYGDFPTYIMRCEKELPRNESCKLIAVPDNEEDG